MQAYPHEYRVRASATPAGPVPVHAEGVPQLQTWPPPEFDGPPGHWSPETLLMAAVADCYVLSFRAVARASRLAWEDLKVDVEGVLDRVAGVARFTEIRILPTLTLRDPDTVNLAQTVLDKAKRMCLVTNSLTSHCLLEPRVEVVA